MVSFAEPKFLASLRALEPNGAFPQKMLKMFGLTFFEKKKIQILCWTVSYLVERKYCLSSTQKQFPCFVFLSLATIRNMFSYFSLQTILRKFISGFVTNISFLAFSNVCSFKNQKERTDLMKFLILKNDKQKK